MDHDVAFQRAELIQPDLARHAQAVIHADGRVEAGGIKGVERHSAAARFHRHLHIIKLIGGASLRMATVASTSARSQPSTSTLPCTFTTETWPPGGSSKRFSQTRSVAVRGPDPAAQAQGEREEQGELQRECETRNWKSKLEIREAHGREFRISIFEFRLRRSRLLVMIVLIPFLLALLPFLFQFLAAAIFFRAPLLPGFPVAFFALLQFPQRGFIDFANLDVARHGPNFQDFSPAIQSSMAAKGGGNQFFLVALNVERKVGVDLAAGRGRRWPHRW